MKVYVVMPSYVTTQTIASKKKQFIHHRITNCKRPTSRGLEKEIIYHVENHISTIRIQPVRLHLNIWARRWRKWEKHNQIKYYWIAINFYPNHYIFITIEELTIKMQLPKNWYEDHRLSGCLVVWCNRSIKKSWGFKCLVNSTAQNISVGPTE